MYGTMVGTSEFDTEKKNINIDGKWKSIPSPISHQNIAAWLLQAQLTSVMTRDNMCQSL